MKAFYLAILTAFIWGMVPILEKVGLSGVSPQAGMVFRCLGVMIGASLLVAINPGIIREASSVGIKGVYLFLIAGFLANFVGQLLFYNALKAGEASKVTPIAGSFPLVTFCLGVLVFGETVTIHKIGGIMLILSGLFLLKG
ncbi:EamA family transporter [Candidatus Omnitrophota bacterium]